MDSTHPRRASLPPEIWIVIFRHATHVPGTLVPDIYDHAGAIGPVYNNACKIRLREALITKRALVRVCKQWWYLAVPYLYESVYIGLNRGLTSLSSTLARSIGGDGILVSTQPLGKYTKRLDVAIRDHSDDLVATSRLLTMVIEHMPHLSIVSFVTLSVADFSLVTDLPCDVLDALHSSAPSLRVLDWSTTRVIPSVFQIMNLLPRCTQLRVLNWPRLHWTKELDHHVFPSTLSTLSLGTIFRDGTTSSYPYDPNTIYPPGSAALQEVILGLNMDHNRWKDLLHTYSSQLVSVQFDIPTRPAIDLEAHMEVLTQACPNLRRLTLISACFSCLIRPNLVFPSITYLGLRVTLNQLPRLDYEVLFDFLEDLVLRIPSLKVVQLLNERNLQRLLNSHSKFVVRALQPFMENSPFRMEDKDGILLTDRLRMLGHL